MSVYKLIRDRDYVVAEGKTLRLQPPWGSGLKVLGEGDVLQFKRKVGNRGVFLVEGKEFLAPLKYAQPVLNEA